MDEVAETLARLPLAGIAAEEFAHNLQDRRFADILAVKGVGALAVEGAGEGRDCTCRARGRVNQQEAASSAIALTKPCSTAASEPEINSAALRENRSASARRRSRASGVTARAAARSSSDARRS
jgi:hypothetical protein